jgi:hypothetical protein
MTGRSRWIAVTRSSDEKPVRLARIKQNRYNWYLGLLSFYRNNQQASTILWDYPFKMFDTIFRLRMTVLARNVYTIHYYQICVDDADSVSDTGNEENPRKRPPGTYIM